MLAKLLKLDTSTGSDLSKFTDSAQIPVWSKPMNCAFVANGIYGGYNNGTIGFDNALTRAETFVMLDRALSVKVAVAYDQAGVYGPATGHETIVGDLHINASGVALRNVTIKGNLTFGEGIGEGEAMILDVKVDGVTFVRGGGLHSVYIVESDLGEVEVNKPSGDIRVAIDDQSKINHIMMYTNTTITSTTAAEANAAVLSKNAMKREVNVLAFSPSAAGSGAAAGSTPAILIGKPAIITASVAAIPAVGVPQAVSIQVNVDTLNVASDHSQTSVTGNIDNLTVTADDTIVTTNGNISKATISGNNNSIVNQGTIGTLTTTPGSSNNTVSIVYDNGTTKDVGLVGGSTLTDVNSTNPAVTITPDSTTTVEILATPTADPASGNIAIGTLVSLSATGGAKIYFTLDGSVPTTSSTPYSGPLIIMSSRTIKAIAVKDGSTNSSVASFEYTVVSQIVLPDSISPLTQGESYTGSVAKLSGGTGAITYAVTSGVLPAGLTLNPSTGAITGIPNDSGSYTFTISATDSAWLQDTGTKQYTGTIAPALTSALDLINEASESGVWTDVNADTFANAGVTGVTSSNLAAVKDALDDDDNAPWTVAELQDIVDEVINKLTKQAALNTINMAASATDWIGVTTDTFATAGVTGVDSSNLSAVTAALNVNGSTARSLAQIQAVVDNVDTPLALDLIDNASQSDNWSSVTVETFEAAGMIGVTEENVISITIALGYGYTGYLSSSALQNAINLILSAIGVALSDINDAAESGDWGLISEDQLNMIGVREVNASNVTQIVNILKAQIGHVWTVAELQASIKGILGQ